MRRGWALLISIAACGREPSVRPAPEDAAPSSSPTADPNEVAGVGVDLASCLAGCRARAEGRLDEEPTVDYTKGGRARIHAVVDAEMDCREKCLTDDRAGLLCEACAQEMEHAVALHECVGWGYAGKGQKCRWSFPERTFELRCCHYTWEGEPAHEVNASTSCPSSGTCSQDYE